MDVNCKLNSSLAIFRYKTPTFHDPAAPVSKIYISLKNASHCGNQIDCEWVSWWLLIITYHITSYTYLMYWVQCELSVFPVVPLIRYWQLPITLSTNSSWLKIENVCCNSEKDSLKGWKVLHQKQKSDGYQRLCSPFKPLPMMFSPFSCFSFNRSLFLFDRG